MNALPPCHGPRSPHEARAVVTRFAPSPSGNLHIGHAYSAHFAREAARQAGGRYLVRIEDIDPTRCRAEFIEANLGDLGWLGLQSDEPVVRQSQRLSLYARAVRRLKERNLVYPCFCTRRRIREDLAASGDSARLSESDGGVIYPGTCRGLSLSERRRRIDAGEPFAIRLDVGRSLAETGPLSWTDRRLGTRRVTGERTDDVIVARRDAPVSYHLAVVVDDAAQGVTVVTRGEDLLGATPIHRLLYALLDLPVPVWHHHALCRDSAGRKLAKRDGDAALSALRATGLSPQAVMALAIGSIGGAETIDNSGAETIDGGDTAGVT
ncbi:MAG: tRNA glutamyl-Q(34) synthetase GluQRS [Rhodospirillales bacterium]|nr:tRNA glutamyl-Q(34) synthetase GluQRS [Rhodospirillales bacterium]